MFDESERSKLARELHDRVGHIVAAMNFDLDRLGRTHGPSEVAGIRRRFDELTEALRDVVSDWRDEPSGSRASLHSLVEAWAEGREVEAVLSLPPADAPPVPTALLTVAEDVVREALTNVSRHAPGAARVEIDLRWLDPRRLRLEIADDGPGLAPQTSGVANGRRHGLAIMRERLAEVGGTLQVEIGEKSSGARLTAEFDVESLHAAD